MGIINFGLDLEQHFRQICHGGIDCCFCFVGGLAKSIYSLQNRVLCASNLGSEPDLQLGAVISEFRNPKVDARLLFSVYLLKDGEYSNETRDLSLPE